MFLKRFLEQWANGSFHGNFLGARSQRDVNNDRIPHYF
jgi:hypothetical protein